jgi:hypothetical protein
MEEQLNLFEDPEDPQQYYAVIFCSNIMKDQFGVIWEQQEIVKSNLSLEAAKILTAKLNSENFSSSGKYYKTIEIEVENFLIH